MRATLLGALLLWPLPLTRAAAAAPPQRQALSFRLDFIPSGQNAYLYYGAQQGVFAKHGFDIDIRPGKGSSLAAKLIGSGAEDAGIVAAGNLLTAVNKGLKLQAIQTLYHHNPIAIIFMPGKGIKKPRELYGKSLATAPQGSAYEAYTGFCALQGLDRRKIKELLLAPAPANRLFLDGKVDARVLPVFDFPPGPRYDVLPLSEQGVKGYWATVAVGPKLMGDKDAVRRLKAAIVESLDLARADPQAALLALKKATGVERQEEAMKIYLQGVYGDETPRLGVGYQTAEGWKETAQALHEMGLIENPDASTRAFWRE